MPLTKQYLRYSPAGVFNIIASNICNITFIKWKGQAGRFVAVGGSEDVIIWDLRLAEKSLVLQGEKFEVTRLAASPNGRHLAVGYADGTIKIFDLDSSECVCTFSGHRSAIVCLSFNNDGQLLASGSRDTEVVIWDTVSERGTLRLSGHKGVITQVCFMNDLPVVITSSKDTFIKFWDLDTGHCFKTLAGHKAEVWDLVLMRDDNFLVSGSSDSELFLWRLTPTEANSSEQQGAAATVAISGEDIVDNFGAVQCTKAGAVLRNGLGRLQALSCDTAHHVLACHATDNCIELFHFNSAEEAQNRLRKRHKKWRKKIATSTTEEPAAEPIPEPTLSVVDEVRRMTVIKCSDKVKSCHVACGKGEIRVCAQLRSNKIELHSAKLDAKESSCLMVLDKKGHRSDVKAVCFSSDSLAIATGSSEAVKLWNRPSQSCLRTLDTSHVYSLCFAPGDRHLLIGQAKQLLVADVNTAEILEEIPAHEKEIWSIVLLPDQRGCVTGSGDKTVKFWDFELVVPENAQRGKAKVLSLLHTRTLKVDEGVLCVCVSPSSQHVAVSLLDSTVKIFFLDSLKFFVSLYGHKLPVLCMDISYDSTLIATGSADRNIKIWGMDFGDCHKSMFAHDDTVTGLKFVPKTHYFFSCGKDGLVKQWDADCFERIQTLQGHHGAAQALAVSSGHVVSCGLDRVVRVWALTTEPLVLEDEREEERAQEEETALATEADTIVPGQASHSLPSRKTVGSEKAAELLLEAIELAETYRQSLEEFKEEKGKDDAKPQPPPLMMALGIDDPDAFLLDTLKNIRASDLEEALLLLPFSSVCQLLHAMPNMLESSSQGEVVLRTLSFLTKVHHEPIVGTANLLPVMTRLQTLALTTVDKFRDRVGRNMAGLQMHQRRLEMEQNIRLFRDATKKRKEKDSKKRRRELAARRAIMTL